MLSRKMKLTFGLAMLGLCATATPTLAHSPGKVHVVHTQVHHVVHPVAVKKVVVVKRPYAFYGHRKVVVVNKRRPVVRVALSNTQTPKGE